LNFEAQQDRHIVEVQTDKCIARPNDKCDVQLNKHDVAYSYQVPFLHLHRSCGTLWYM